MADPLFTRLAPGELIPVELMIRDRVVNLYLSGDGNCTFPEDPNHLDEDGQPRRIQWVRRSENARVLTGTRYNKQGMATVFRIANDLLEATQIRDLQGKITKAAEQALADATAKQGADVDGLRADMQDQIAQLVRDLQTLTKRVGMLEAVKRPGRPKAEKAAEDDVHGAEV